MLKNNIKIHLQIICFTLFISCQSNKKIIKDNLVFKIYTYSFENKLKASAMPEIKKDFIFSSHKRRFEYLLLNVPKIHTHQLTNERNKIFNFFPDTLKIKESYLKKLVSDKKLNLYFKITYNALSHSKSKPHAIFNQNELMEIVSKFFYCDEVNPDTSIQSHVCIGLNGLKETKWKKDYILLEAFCFETIFNDFDKDSSIIYNSYLLEKSNSIQYFKKNIISLDNYLENVKHDLFKRMKTNLILKQELLRYYEINKDNLPFKLVN